MLKLEAIGNLVADPISRTIQKGENDGKVTNFRLAASYGFSEFKHTEYIRVAAWNGLGRTCEQYLRKGSKVWISGTPSVNSYINSDGEAAGNLEIRLEEIEFLTPKSAETAINNEETDEDIEDLL